MPRADVGAGFRGDIVNATDYQLAQQGFVREGVDRALALGNRGPLKFDQDGGLHEEIIAVSYTHLRAHET